LSINDLSVQVKATIGGEEEVDDHSNKSVIAGV
jgi:hypothetical protein